MILDWINNKFGPENYYEYIFKPIPLALMTILYTYESKKTINKFTVGNFCGFFFSLLGDILLMLNGDMMFMLGLASFAIAHLSFIYSCLINYLTQKSEH